MYGGPQHDRHAHTDYSPSNSRFIYFLLSWVPAYNSRNINGSIIQQGMFAPILIVISMAIYNWLVVYLPLWKIWKSRGRIIPIYYGKIEFMFQTTNQYTYIYIYIRRPLPTAGGARQRRDYKQQVLCSASEGQARGGQKGKPGAE